jgi:hypothetical protein
MKKLPTIQAIILSLAMVFTAFTLALSISPHAFADPQPLQQIEDQQQNTAANANCENTPDAEAVQKCVQSSRIVKDIQILVNFLSAGVGIVVVIMIIVGGIQYSIAGDNAQRVTAAKQRIINALIALVAFMFIFSFLQWLIPGGIFN